MKLIGAHIGYTYKKCKSRIILLTFNIPYRKGSWNKFQFAYIFKIRIL